MQLNSLALLLAFLSSANTIESSSPLELWPQFISHFNSNFFPNAKIFLIYGDFFPDDTDHLSKSRWLERLEGVLSQNYIISSSGGITQIKLQRNQSDSLFIPRPPKTLSDIVQIVIMLLPVGIPGAQQEEILFQRLNAPLLDPATVRDEDKYFIITEKSHLNSLYQRDVIRKIKYKTFLTPEVNSLTLHQFCLHCPIPEKVITLSSNFESEPDNQLTVLDYFPNFQLNYFGYVLRVSSTDKMSGDLEFGVDVNGKTYAKRGVFAAAMYHLAEGLNFTAELYRSSAGASTGHKLGNGTWVGSVGDIYSGDASFCMLCGMSYSRHFIVDICSPVTYEYIRFAIGPSAKLYTWQAIFWPFDITLWMAFLTCSLTTIVCCFLFLKFQPNHSKWTIVTVSKFFGSIFIEQSDDIPVGLPESVKIVLGYWLLFALVATNIYRAKMVTFMTFPVFESSPDTYDELIKTNYQIEFHYFPNIAYNSFKASTNPVIMEVFQKMIKQTDPIKCLQHTLETKSVCIMFTSVHDDFISRNMSDRNGLTPIRSSNQYAFFFTPGISSQKRADFTRNFRKILQTSLAMGLNGQWVRSDASSLLKEKNDWIKSIPPGGDTTGVFQYDFGDSDDVLRLKHLKGAFTVLTGGCLIALAGFLGEQGVQFLGRAKVKKVEFHTRWRDQAD